MLQQQNVAIHYGMRQTGSNVMSLRNAKEIPESVEGQRSNATQFRWYRPLGDRVQTVWTIEGQGLD